MSLLKAYWYGIFIDYHTKKGMKINRNYMTLRMYHYEKALYYYEKAYGEEYESKSNKVGDPSIS